MVSLKNPILPLRILLAIVGVVIIFLGFNVGFGGIKTLGWQGPTDFVEVVDTSAFRTQDSHFRFLGGVWLGIGFVFLAGAFALQRLRNVLIVLCGVIFVGGIARLSGLDFRTLFSLSVLPSLVAELFLFPLLGYWISRSGKVHN
ncbi:DUF4345 domain-containing protein [Nitratireductor sp. XY-223]|uniref:DUF4345 domain-containing protein n=1 Tax=Nitratireductor sp. XY-223 TaxID=2561926 RepID=UPI0010AA43F9|nr:DUF4345 domain-containing protein [Nitratireductor sp. XY-223]